MPILEIPSPDQELSQGNILKGICLFNTLGASSDDDGTPDEADGELCLVLSRPCVIAHKETVVVANISAFPDKPAKEFDFARALLFLKAMRDGHGSPDVFFLGQVPGYSGRFGARFDRLYTVGIPVDPDERAAFVAARRVASLTDSFVRDLHLRIFSAFASLGFDDQGWLPDDELSWLVDHGNADIAKAESLVATKNADIKERGLRGLPSSKKGAQEQKELNNLQNDVDKTSGLVQPYIDELQRRAEAARVAEGENEGN